METFIFYLCAIFIVIAMATNNIVIISGGLVCGIIIYVLCKNSTETQIKQFTGVTWIKEKFNFNIIDE